MGTSGNYPWHAIVRALSYQLRTPVSFGGGRDRAAGFLLIDRSTRATWAKGDEVEADPLDLLLTVSVRRVTHERLDGSGASRLIGAAAGTSASRERRQ